MNKWYAVLFYLACASLLFADKRITSIVKDVNTISREPYMSFDIGDYQRGLFFNVHSWFSTRKARWLYRVSVAGRGDEFPASKVSVKNELAIPSPVLVPVVGGKVTIDRKNKSVTIALKVRHGDSIVDFDGNGTFAIEL